MIIQKLALTFVFLCTSLLELNYSYLTESGIRFFSFQNYVPALQPYDWILCLAYLVLGTLLWFRVRKQDKDKADFYLEYLARIGLGFMFIAASINKIADPESFAMLVAQYQALPSFLVNIFSLWLPVFELVVGVALLIGPKTKINAYLILFMMVLFIIALIQALIRDLGITCGCFDLEGSSDKKGAWISLVRDFVLLPPLVFLIKRDRNAWIWNFKAKKMD